MPSQNDQNSRRAGLKTRDFKTRPPGRQKSEKLLNEFPESFQHREIRLQIPTCPFCRSHGLPASSQGTDFSPQPANSEAPSLPNDMGLVTGGAHPGSQPTNQYDKPKYGKKFRVRTQKVLQVISSLLACSLRIV